MGDPDAPPSAPASGGPANDGFDPELHPELFPPSHAPSAPDTSPDLPPPPAATLPSDPQQAPAPPSTIDEPEAPQSTEEPQQRSADPFARIDEVLTSLQSQGFKVSAKERTQNALQGEILLATLEGTRSALLRYELQTAAQDGYQLLVEPIGRARYRLTAFVARTEQERGLAFVNARSIPLEGSFRKGESAAMLRKFAALPPDGVLYAASLDQLESLGYRVAFEATADSGLLLTVAPGRAIREVRIRGHIPLPARQITRALSPATRPGALVRGQCVSRSQLRRNPPPSVCAPDDAACKRWESDEITRLEDFLFDNGYLRGTARLGLACGRRAGEADLYVFLAKGPAFRARPIDILSRNLSKKQQRWIRRIFRPTISPFLPISKRVTRKHLDQARERVAREYAQPASGPLSRSRRGLEPNSGGPQSDIALPYPALRISTNFERLRREDVPNKGNKIPLVVTIDLGDGVQTDFLGNEKLSESRLKKQLQLFERREPASAATARREAENLRNYYQARGFPLASVQGIFTSFSAYKKLIFRISEGPRARIRDLDLRAGKDLPRRVDRQIRRDFRREHELRRLGRFSDAAARKDLSTLLSSLAAQGYLCATAQLRVAFWEEGFDRSGAHAVFDLATAIDQPGQPTWLERQLDASGLARLRQTDSAGLYVRIEVDPGPRVVTSSREAIDHLEVRIPPSREVEALPQTQFGAWGAPRILRGTSLRRRNDERPGGIPVSLELASDVEHQVATQYRRSGYPLADAELRWVYRGRDGVAHKVPRAEGLTANQVGLCREHRVSPRVEVDVELAVYEGRKGTFGEQLVRGNFKTKDYVLKREIKWEQGETYDQGKIERTRNAIEGVDVTETVEIREQPNHCELTDSSNEPCVVNEVISITESKDRALDLAWGLGGTTLDPLYVFIRPSFPNVFGTAWDLRLDGHLGTNPPGLRSQFCGEQDCFERSARVSLIRRRILASPLTFEIAGQVQRRVTPARGRIDSALGQVRLTWPINDKWQVYVGYLVQAANVSKSLVKPRPASGTSCGTAGNLPCTFPNRSEAIVADRTAALQTGAAWQRVDNPFNPDKGFIATADAMLASPWLGGQDWWFRYEFGWQHFIPIPRTNQRLGFRYSLNYGHAIPIPNAPGADTRSIPEVWRYFGGGTVDLGLRGIEPQTMLIDIEEIPGPFGLKTLRPVAQGGHIRALGTVALQVVSVRNVFGVRLAHSLFMDFGILTQRWQQVRFGRDLRGSVGINALKIDVRIATVSLGYAILIPNVIWPGNVRPTDDKNGRFVFDVGATF